jgi:aspartyl/asparaginyl beta-hydroxylase (cupin superfamily)
MASSHPSQAQIQVGISALQSGDPHRARQAFEAAARMGDTSPQLWLYLAHTALMLTDPGAADRALDRVLQSEPGNLYALCMKGDIAAGQGDDRKATGYYQFALSQATGAQVSADLAERLRAAERAVQGYRVRFRQTLDAVLTDAPHPLPARFQEAMAIVSGEAQPYPQSPTSFYYPRLAPIPFFETDGLDWVAKLEAAGPAIRAELLALFGEEDGFTPYVEAHPDRPNRGHALLNDPRWSALHLWQAGHVVPEQAERCPVTMAVLERMPMPRIAGRSPMALFSLLRARTHIPPHTGMLNTRLICHLPLIVPDRCRLRVGADIREVEPLKAMLFDDSIEHEAWNDSDEIRVVLLFEVWRPELDASEQSLLTRMFETVVDYRA